MITPPQRLVYLSSGMHRSGRPDLADLQWDRRPWSPAQAYSDSKLFDVVLAFALARRWPQVLSNALEPGWVATKMGGPGAPDDLGQAHLTQPWLAVSDDPAATVSGAYFYHKARRVPHPAVTSTEVQEGLLAACEQLTGTPLPVSGRPAPPADRRKVP
jgi:NAD(P)-dependent dehydrogenase (short-subunit alcohol dehydrogenase family)